MSRRPMRRDREHVYQGQGLGQAGTAPTLFEQVLALSAGRPVFTADNYAEVGGKVVGFIDWNDPTHLLSQPASVARVPTPAPHADFAGALCATFTTGERYVSTRPPAQWSFVHDGASVETVFALSSLDAAAVGVLYATRVTGSGAQVYTNANTLVYFSQASAGSIGPIAFGPAATGVPTFTDIRHQEPPYELRVKNAVGASGDVSPTNETGDAALQLGAVADGSYPSKLRWPAIAFFPALTPAQRSVVQQWIQAAYGIAA